MNKIILSMSSLLLVTNIFSQTHWLKKAGGTTHDEALDITSDNNGNYYVTGYFSGQATFDNISLNTSGNSDVFIAKYNSNGVLQWVSKAGGSMADRGYSIKADNTGNVYVTGFYNGTATFGSQTITAVSNSQDVFVSKLDPNGNFLWTISLGGNKGDTGYGVTVDSNGDVIVTGQFKGSASFGNIIFNSMINPIINDYSFDIFVCKLNSSGVVLWAKHGKSKYDNRGLDIATDDANNIYMVGQFSDTLSFDFTHNNTIMNSGILIKFDSNGNEQWMRKIAGIQTIVYAIAINNQNEIYITGDFKGQLTIFTNPLVISNSNYTNKIFVAKFNTQGNVIWLENDGSENEVTSKSIAIDNQGDAYITGLFKCRFTEYSQQFGEGVFYSAGWRDVFITKYSSSGNRQWMRHFGGPKDDYCSGIAINNPNQPVIAGSFENYFNVPISNNNQFSLNTGDTYINLPLSGYCSDISYGLYYNLKSLNNAKQIFVGNIYVPNREPMDYFVRQNLSCIRDTLVPCIENCADTFSICDKKLNLISNTFSYQNGILGPEYEYLWSNGSIASSYNPQASPTQYITQMGDYWVKINRADNCWLHNDSVYIYVFQSPVITDSWGVNINKLPPTIPLSVCDSATELITNKPPLADTIYWSSNQSFSYVNDTTITLNQSGTYIATSVYFNGHTCINNIPITYLNYGQSYTSLPSIHFTDSIYEATDTVIICQGQTWGMYALDTNLISQFGNAYLPGNLQWYITNNTTQQTSTLDNDYLHNFTVTQSGYYTVGIDSAYYICGDTIIIIPNSRTFYVVVNSKPTINLTYNITQHVCPGDTITIYINTNTTTVNWSGPNIIAIYTDSIHAIAGTNNATYNVSASITDTLTGCSNSLSITINYYARPKPQISMNPLNGLVCPGDSVLLSAPSALAWEWVGPNGNSFSTTQQVYVNDPGFYHCIVTDITGCIMTSNFVETKEYNSPFLTFAPDNHICANGQVTITVNSNFNALIQWQSPLTGSNNVVTVNSPGTYICYMTLCGITTIDSVVVTQSNTLSVITGPNQICSGD